MKSPWQPIGQPRSTSRSVQSPGGSCSCARFHRNTNLPPSVKASVSPPLLLSPPFILPSTPSPSCCLSAKAFNLCDLGDGGDHTGQTGLSALSVLRPIKTSKQHQRRQRVIPPACSIHLCLCSPPHLVITYSHTSGGGRGFVGVGSLQVKRPLA